MGMRWWCNYLPIHQVPLRTNTFSGGTPHSPLKSRLRSNSPVPRKPNLLCCHTRNSAEPGRYSHRSTALPRSKRLLKSRSEKVNAGAAPAASGSTV